ncbi:MAG: nicotinate (nicotinamide) nucleotide adenylyltransferase [Sulfurovum sp.]|nr:nicotinate (nicotinamide) nucleotide adenylyltransferase [Sulfurovum sp.]
MVKDKPIIALFGGSFDPPHEGHQAIIKKVGSFDDIDKLIIMPAFINPFKNHTMASAQKRLEWCKLLFDEKDIIVSDFEVSKDRPVYTIETLRSLQKNYIVKYLIIGSDNLEEIEQWHEFDEINDIVIWAVFTRDTNQPDCKMLRQYRLFKLNIPMSSTEIRTGKSLEQIEEYMLNNIKQAQSVKQQKDKNDNQR